MSKVKSAEKPGRSRWHWWMLCLLLVALGLQLAPGFMPGKVLASNDGPLGRLMEECHQLPQAFKGVWDDLNSAGYREQGASPNLTYALRWLLQPVLFSKFYAFFSLLLLGMAAWLFFRQFGLSPPACLLGGAAAALNSDFFSTACWGVAAHPIAVAATFLAFAALLESQGWNGWLRTALAGILVGLAVSEAADVGVILSVYTASFLCYQTLVAQEPALKRFAVGFTRLALVTVLALLVAAQSVFALVGTQIEGVKGTNQDENTRENRWEWATQWSLPKCEALGLVVPGLFGFRMATPDGGCYWGELGQDHRWTDYFKGTTNTPPAGGFVRQTGSGIYAGVLVAVVAFWAIAQSLRRKNSALEPAHRKWAWFWLASFIVCLLLSFGKHAPSTRCFTGCPTFPPSAIRSSSWTSQILRW